MSLSLNIRWKSVIFQFEWLAIVRACECARERVVCPLMRCDDRKITKTYPKCKSRSVDSVIFCVSVAVQTEWIYLIWIHLFWLGFVVCVSSPLLLFVLSFLFVSHQCLCASRTAFFSVKRYFWIVTRSPMTNSPSNKMKYNKSKTKTIAYHAHIKLKFKPQV